MPEKTDFATQLARLAPEVDETASRELFERRRRASWTSRWAVAAAAVLVVAGIAGLVMVNARDDTPPATPSDTTLPQPIELVDSALRPAPGETLIAGEEHFDVITVAETTVGFGNAELVLSQDELTSLWTEWNPGIDQPVVDTAGNIALVMTRPGDACADVVTRFEVNDDGGTPVWTPVFESPFDACEAPLLSWIHVIAIDRAALGETARIRVPAAEVFEVPEQIIEYTAPEGDAGESPDPQPVTLTVTDVVVSLPPVGEPALHNTSLGLFYVVHHEDGEVSVLPATVDGHPTADEGVTMLQSLVIPSESGLSFSGGGNIWDSWGRGVTGGRVSDLAGYAGQVEGGAVEVLLSDATRIEGDPELPDGETYTRPPGLWEPITPLEWLTLSSSGPIWRLFDAQLVVEDGVGRICQVDTGVPVTELSGCDETRIAIDTRVTSANPDITTWYESPVLAFQDPVRGFTAVAPLSGWSSRNDAAVDD